MKCYIIYTMRVATSKQGTVKAWDEFNFNRASVLSSVIVFTEHTFIIKFYYLILPSQAVEGQHE